MQGLSKTGCSRQHCCMRMQESHQKHPCQGRLTGQRAPMRRQPPVRCLLGVSKEPSSGERPTLRAHDEVVDVRPGGHAGDLAALLHHSTRGHHFYVNHLVQKVKRRGGPSLTLIEELVVNLTPTATLVNLQWRSNYCRFYFFFLHAEPSVCSSKQRKGISKLTHH